MHLEPARSIIAKLGGPDRVARITGRDISRVYRWMYGRDQGGTEGVIPHIEARKLLDHASANGIDLKPEEFFATRGMKDVVSSSSPTPAATGEAA